jgi:hypothetical protein
LASSTSRASVDLPEPDTPVTATSRFSGTMTFTLARLCSVAPFTFSCCTSPLIGRRACCGCFMACSR